MAPNPINWPVQPKARAPNKGEQDFVNIVNEEEGTGVPELHGKPWSVYDLKQPKPDVIWTCLHWALDVYLRPLGPPPEYPANSDTWIDDELWFELKPRIARFSEHNLTRTTNEAEADVDVYFDGPNIRHFSRKLENGDWVSKLGLSGPLVKHERAALDGGPYGTRKEFYKWSGPQAHANVAMSEPAPSVVAEQQDEIDGLIHAHAGLASKVVSLPKTTGQPTTHNPPPTHNPLTHPVTNNPPTHPVTNNPPTHPVTNNPPTHPVTNHPPTHPVTNNPPTHNPPPTSPDNNVLKQLFEKNWELLLARLKKPSRFSDPRGLLLDTPQWLAIKKEGQGVLPFLAEKLTSGKYDVICVLAIFDLDPALKITGSVAQQKQHILTSLAAKTRVVSQKVALVAQQEKSIINSGVEGAKLIEELTENPVFKQVVQEGVHAVPHILEAYGKDGSHGVKLWLEMLKQIHAIAAHSSDIAEEKKEFEKWLGDYLKPEQPSTNGSTS